MGFLMIMTFFPQNLTQSYSALFFSLCNLNLSDIQKVQMQKHISLSLWYKTPTSLLRIDSLYFWNSIKWPFLMRRNSPPLTNQTWWLWWREKKNAVCLLENPKQQHEWLAQLCFSDVFIIFFVSCSISLPISVLFSCFSKESHSTELFNIG